MKAFELNLKEVTKAEALAGEPERAPSMIGG